MVFHNFITIYLDVLLFPTLEFKYLRFLHRSSFILVLHLAVQCFFFFIDCFLPVFTKLATAGLFLVSYCYLSTLYIASSPVCAEYKISSPDVCHLYPESLHLASTKPSMSIYSLSMVCSSQCCTWTALAFQDLMLVIDLTD